MGDATRVIARAESAACAARDAIIVGRCAARGATADALSIRFWLTTPDFQIAARPGRRTSRERCVLPPRQ